jgi:Glycosyltransferases involved in cell wall biogenesis
MTKTTVLIPVLNDWKNLGIILQDLDNGPSRELDSLHVIVVNDGSSENLQQQGFEFKNIKLSEIQLTVNLGHQRAIAVGLCYIAEMQSIPNVILIMDADGEDLISDIPLLINEAARNNYEKIVFAGRKKRSERLSFIIYYALYRVLFYFLTGQKPKFGNFSCIPGTFLHKIVHNADFWNHYSASVVKNNMPYVVVPTNRGRRIHGESKMNTTSLILHGLSAISLYLDVIAVKFMRIALFILVVMLLILPVIIYIKYFTVLAIPGWASYLFAIILNIIVTTMLLTFILVLQLLNNRNRKPEQPIMHYKNLIYSVNTPRP